MPKRRVAPYRIGQIIGTVVLNAYILAYIQGKIIYSGFLKSIPEPVLNCYGGPLSVFACPLGSFQQIFGQQGLAFYLRIPWVIIGLVVIIGAFVGRTPCAWVCPFGLWQDLLYKIKVGPQAKGKRWLTFSVIGLIGLVVVALLVVFVKVNLFKALLFGWLPFIVLCLFGALKGKMNLPGRWFLSGTLVGIGLGLFVGWKHDINLGIASGVVALTLFSLASSKVTLLLAVPTGFVISLFGRGVQLGPFAGAELGMLFAIFAFLVVMVFDQWLKISLPATGLKYLFLLLVAGLVAFFTGEPWFCKLCPQGTLEAGIPLVLWDPVQGLRALVSWLFYLKVGILLFVIWAAMLIKRPFCRIVCPIGAVYSIFNRVSLLRLKLNRESCTRCQVCRRVCPTDIEPYEEPNQTDCIRCFECVWKCPRSSLKITLGG
ncbi:MAG: 4Fe-4S binding protein [candidate division WOR-3 bacterium]